MKKFALVFAAFALLLLACGQPATPEKVTDDFFLSMQNADGDLMVSLLSSEAVAGLEETIEGFKEDPEGNAAVFAMLGIGVTPDEITNFTPASFLSAIFGSELIQSQLNLSGEEFKIGEATIDGDEATVTVIVDENETPVPLVRENGEWKISGEYFESFM